MHRPGVVSQEQFARAQFLNQLFERRLADQIGAAFPSVVAICAPIPASFAVPKSTHWPPSASAVSANRSGNQRFAGPYSAPGQSPNLCPPPRVSGGERQSRPPPPSRLTIARDRDNAPPDEAAGRSARPGAPPDSKASADDVRHSPPAAEFFPAKARARCVRNSEKRSRHRKAAPAAERARPPADSSCLTKSRHPLPAPAARPQRFFPAPKP